MSDIKKELIDFETHCFEMGQHQVGELISNALTHIAELEKEKETLRVICEESDGIACNCTITDSQAVERLLDLFDKKRDFYIPLQQGK
jgi:adenine/guanine phosphoribosyltransferase-like PRPP-binding protein